MLAKVLEFPHAEPGAAPLDLEVTLTELVPVVRAWMWRLLGPRVDYDDAVQDALIELAKALPSFEGRSKVTTFAHPIVVRTAYRYMRAPREVAPSDPDTVAGTDDPERRVAHRQELDRLHRVLGQLPETARVAFVLCAVERLAHEEAAAIEGVSVETLRARLKRAKAELARRLRADPELASMLGGRT
ncbi:MAG: sigma-70 family RNA polymerase sigma factor [Sandaracinaceae bacterium]|nr:sigma-70 family RNA polymerase sigma factor [Sandaracinaceae bacterium]